ncbi:hypothetical protein SK128_004694 [Halocaridina rubra]|uniref:FLYWCH-type domain-containing protein n=1 Tax=Halocaridina rubra TaxID=373956 RepID=A0AAN8WJ98_HALRR
MDGREFSWVCPDCEEYHLEAVNSSPERVWASDFNVDTTIDDVQQLHENSIRVDTNIPEVLPEDSPITWTVVATGTKRMKPRLHDSRGYTYTVRGKTAMSTYWWCSIRQKDNRCPATVTEKDNSFKPGANPHNHPGDPGALLKTQVRVQVLEFCGSSTDTRAAPVIAEEALQTHKTATSQILHKLENDIRAGQRKRQFLRPPEPS